MNESEKILYAKESGMSVDDINAHLDKFSNGGSYLVRDDAFERFTDGKPMLGYPDNSNYVLSSSEMDKVIENSHGDIGYIEDQLGFPNGYFGDGPIHRVDVNNPMDHDVRMATGKEMGGNVFFNTPTDSNGNLPDIKQSWNENNISPNNSNKSLPTISTSDNNPNDISKLKGEYFDGNGQYHSPNLAGYRGTTSGGNSEAHNSYNEM